MISGTHAIVYADDAEKARAFFRDVLEWPHVDAGDGWLVFALPPAELAVHPTDGDVGRHELFLMCTDVRRTVDDLVAKGVHVTAPITDEGWGLATSMNVPGADPIRLYQPKHPTAYDL